MLILFNLKTWFLELVYEILLFFDGLVFQLASYAYRLFSLMTTLNFNSLYAIVSPVIDRFQAIIIVLVAYKLVMGLINLLMNPENAPAFGKDMLINIFITVALMLSYNLIFSVMNEISMLILGTPPGYSYTVLGELAGVTGGKDVGLIQRFVFGESTDIGDVGDYIAFQTLSIFVRDTTDSNEVEKALVDGDGYDFMKLPALNTKVGKTVEYTPIIGMLVAGFLVYTFVTLAIEVGTRVFKLLVLQMVAPLIIITIIDKGYKGNGTIQSYLKEYFKTFTDVFIRVLSALVITVFISKAIMNIGALFGDATAIGDDWFTKGLLLIIIVFAGYKFVLDLPKFLAAVTGKDFSSGTNGFGKYLGGLVGGTVGFATGAIGGAAAGGGFFSRAGGALAGGIAGMGQGAYSGGKGGSIADAVKNGYGGAHKRNQDWKSRGGFGNVALGGFSDVTGNTRRMDKDMGTYQAQMEAVDAYDQAEKDYQAAFEQAQVDAIKGSTMSTSDQFVIGTDDATGAAVTMGADEIYSSGFQNIQLGENADSYAQTMIEYDREYHQTQASLDAAKAGGDSAAIAEAQRKNIEARRDATKRAIDYWESKKSSASVSVDSSKRDEALSKANKALGNAEGTAIDVKATRRDIQNKQKETQGKRSYKATHTESK